MNPNEQNSDNNEPLTKADGDADEIPMVTQEIPVLDQQIPVLDQPIPVVDQMIPVLDQRIPAQNHVVEIDVDMMPEDTATADNIPVLTIRAETTSSESHDENHQDVTNPNVDQGEAVQPVLLHTQVSDHELEKQLWQIEQQAVAQRGDWDAMADIESASKPEQEAETVNQSHDELTDDQQAVLDASWQRLESLIMDQMPAEIAGTYLSVLEQQLHLSKESIARDIALLDDADLESLLDYYQIDRGF